ncbi:hypothetical protein pb186bvf_006946 [Paramecium bursaria]
MQGLISLLTILLLISYCYTLSFNPQGFQYTRCSCTVFKTQYDCDQNCVGTWCIDSGCIWNGDSCQNPECKDLKTIGQCEINSQCYYEMNSNQCLKFSQCSQLDSDFNGCRGQGCFFPDPTSINNRCQDKPYKIQGNCTQLAAISDCQKTQQDQINCYWVNDKCVRLTCDIIEEQSTCILLNTTCLFQNNKCRQLECTDFLTSKTCDSILDLATTQVKNCLFLQNQCVNPTLDQLNTQDLCSLGTFDSYAYLNGTCQQLNYKQYQLKKQFLLSQVVNKWKKIIIEILK